MRIVTLCMVLGMAILPSPAPGQAGASVDEFLRGWEGKWNATAGYTEDGGRYTVAWSAAEVTRSAGTSMAFTVKPATGTLVFEGSLKPAPSKRYVLTVKSSEDAAVELPLQYAPESGFTGQGTFKSVAVEATVTRTAKGYELSIVDPKLPKGNNYIISLSFFDRKPK